MQQTRTNPLIHLLPSLRDVAFFMPFLFVLFTGGATRMLEGDTGWHIRAGEWMLANGRVPDRDFFSFTKPGEPWYAWEWLWDVVFAWLHQKGGMAAVVFASFLVISFAGVILYREVLKRCQNCLLAIGITFLALSASSIHWWARPHLFTLLFALVTFVWLERAREGEIRVLWYLPALTVLWTNLHGGFFVAILMALSYAAGALVQALLAPDPGTRRIAFRQSAVFTYAITGCAAASLVNPYTYHLHVHIYRYLSSGWHFRNISEFLSISFHHPASRYFEVALFLGISAALWHLVRGRYAYVFLIVGWGHLSLLSGRNIAIYALVAAPLIALAVREWIEQLARANLAGWVRSVLGWFEEFASEIQVNESIPRLPLARLAGGALLALIFLAPAPPKAFRAEYNETYPRKALSELSRRGNTRIFTHDEWGDYLIYKLYPNTKVFVDGRSDFYGEVFCQKYVDTVTLKYGWLQNLTDHRIETVLVPVDAPMASALKESARWKVAYDDGVAIIFESRDRRRAALKSSAVRPGASVRPERSTTIGSGLKRHIQT